MKVLHKLCSRVGSVDLILTNTAVFFALCPCFAYMMNNAVYIPDSSILTASMAVIAVVCINNNT